jgi:DNA-binding response OmpR family regulator
VLLEEHGYSVAVADSVHSARLAYARFKPQVVLLDVVLPDGDGLLLVREWLNGGDGHRSQVLALTGHADDETRLRCLEAGCRDVLIKPVTSTELIQRIAGVAD